MIEQHGAVPEMVYRLREIPMALNPASSGPNHCDLWAKLMICVNADPHASDRYRCCELQPLEKADSAARVLMPDESLLRVVKLIQH